MDSITRTRGDNPRIIQGGMGVGVSNWQLAGAVTAAGQLGVVSGTALEFVHTRQLQNGDPGGHTRRALRRFPNPEMAQRVLDAYFIEGGKQATESFKRVPMVTMEPSIAIQELLVVANFVEVTLAKERGGGGPIGINYLYKIQLPLLASIYGAMLAGVDTVIVGAGNPAQIPAVLSRLAQHQDVALDVRVQYAASADDYKTHFSPRALMPSIAAPLARPRCLAIVASAELAKRLAESPTERPNGFVIEKPVAGGHNAPPRGPRAFDDGGQPLYSALDDVDCAQVRALGLPFWLAGAMARSGGLDGALAAGAEGIQVGTAFALCEESGVEAGLKEDMVRRIVDGTMTVFTDPRASPTGFPFKVVELPGTLADPAVYAERRRVCDVGCLRSVFKTKQGGIGYRCPAEPERVYGSKGGRPQNTAGRKCLCSALLANIGLAQQRKDGAVELPLLTAGDDLACVAQFVQPGQSRYAAADVVQQLLLPTTQRLSA
jgi:NAD(P)H-dependent flavin oxidoreductase YrpB (nitropropane dioxygenase family)